MSQSHKTLSFWQELLTEFPLDNEVASADADFYGVRRQHSKIINARHLLGGTVMILTILGLFG